MTARRREREGGRHGRASFPESAADSSIRSRLVRLTLIPCLLVIAVCVTVTAFVVRAGVVLTGTEGAVLGGGLAVTVVIVLTAVAVANSEARATAARYARLRQVCARSQSDLYNLLDRVRQGEWLQHRDAAPAPLPSGDTLDLLAHEVAAAGRAAESAVIDAVAIARSNASGSEQKVEVFVNLARRLQSLVHREIELLDDLENKVEDPDLLKGLFQVDHLATRTRRHAENLAVLGGAISRRQWSRPVTMTEVLRSAIAEVEQYPRVKLVPPTEGTLRGHAVADVIHLVAELVENASVYSAPQTHVLLRAQLVTAGLAVEVEDRGLGMEPDEQARMNALLADPEHVDVAELLSDGRIGLFVVSSLARRHGIVVQLQGNIYGGVQAVLVLPKSLLGAESHTGGAVDRAAGRREEAAGERGAPAGPTARPALPQTVPAARGPLAAPRPSGEDGQDTHGPAGLPPLPVRTPASGYQTPASDPTDENGENSDNRHSAAAYPADGTAYPPAAEEPAGPGSVVLPPAPHGDDDGSRPHLPRRRKQEHLVPELRGEPVLPGTADREGPEPEHDPGLMAAFRRGISLADDAYEAGHSAGGNDFSPTQSGVFGSLGGNDLFYEPDHEAPPARPRGDDHNHGE
ncbi:ATP-binding protein [Streptomyces pinistramenti]|uniref:ATP-binding protein n=1 Tax=Streptomyces pinistramenti TaxID=2884812 RepID=UPI001D089AAF|nr:ATP-binding protein [Streptomyces pinistramenti]MCB5906085.1 ATP-binding protein [Streptomyces pinistramenti]